MDAINWACKNGELDILKANADLVKNNSDALLFSSCDYGHSEIVEYLIKQGANVNAENRFGITPLLTAIYEEHAKCVNILLVNGAKKNGKTPSGDTYLDAATTDEIKNLLQ